MAIGGHELHTVWTAADDLSTETVAVPATVLDGNVYVATEWTIRAFDAEDGNVVRTYDSAEEVRFGPATDDGLVYVGTVKEGGVGSAGTATIRALDPRGFDAWDVTMNSSRGTALTAGGGLTFATADCRVYGLDARAQQWAFDKRDRDSGDKAYVTDLAYDGGRVIVPARDETVTALDAGDGTRVWQNALPVEPGQLATDGEIVAVGPTPQGSPVLTVFDIASGEPWWRCDIGGPQSTRPVVADEAVYSASHEGAIVALDRSTGDRLWDRSPDGTVGGMLAVEDTLYAAIDGGEIVAYDTYDGSTRTTLSIGIEEPIGLTGWGDRLFVSGSPAPGVVAISTPHGGIGSADGGTDADGTGWEMTCPACGRAIDGDPNFCPDCGSDLSTDEASDRDTQTCPECGDALSGDEAFCPGCGHALSE